MYKAGVGDGLTVLKGIQHVQSWVLVVMIGLVLRASSVYKAGVGDGLTVLKGIQRVQSWVWVMV